MSNSKGKRIRAFSARPMATRPLSGVSRAIQKTEFIENVYGGGLQRPTGATIKKNIPMIGSKSEFENMSKHIHKNTNKQREQLFEDNLHLKRQVNQLTEQLAIMKGQMQSLKKPMNKKNKQLNMEFEKQLYWTGSNAHLVAGVKAQYQKVKQLYQAKCQQCDVIKSDAHSMQVQQMKVYSEELQKENRRLVQKLDKYTEHSQQFVMAKDKQQVCEYLIIQLEEKKERLHKRLLESQTKLKTANEVVKDRDKKIMFLEKLIIEKDNSQYHAIKRAKKSQKSKQQLEQQLERVRKDAQEMKENYEERIRRLRTSEQEKYNIQKQLFEKTLDQKEDRIHKLEKQVAYLSTLLTYWKPAEGGNREGTQRYNESNANEERDSMRMSSSLLGNNNNGLGVPSVKTRKTSRDQSKGTEFIIKNEIKSARIPEYDQQSLKQRVRQTADQRHSEDAKKMRKVSLEGVQQIAQLLRYRFIGHRMTMEDVKARFDYNKSQFIMSQDPDQTEEPWDATYITMKQVKGILTGQGFTLVDEQATTLARYLVQDSNNQYVYCDDNNQIARTVIKSIIRATIREYEVWSQEKRNQIEGQFRETVQLYRQNIRPALKTIASKGYISYKKFIETLSSLGIEVSAECKELFVAKMAMESQNLRKLNYAVLF